jgi:hypothetical protein
MASTQQSTEHFGGSASDEIGLDRDELRAEVQLKYAAVAIDPEAKYHLHTGRSIAERCRYDMEAVDRLPLAAIESGADEVASDRPGHGSGQC